MRIVIGTLSFPPNVSGVAVSVNLLAQFLVKRGHEVHVILPNNSLKSEIVTIENGIILHKIRSVPNLIRPGFYIPVFTKHLVTKRLKEVGPDIIHVHDPMAMSRFLQEAGLQLGIPTVVSNHFTLDYILSYFPKFLKSYAKPHLNRWIIRFYNQCQAVVAPSETVVKVLRQMGVRTPISALSNGIDLERFFASYSTNEARQEFRLPQLPVILYAGRLDKDKSVDVLIEAFATLLKDQPALLLLMGDGQQRTKFTQQCKQLGIANRVIFLGSIPHDSELLVEVFQLAHLFVMPSAIETQCLSILEAMAAAKPVVAANGGALPEVVRHQENGLLFQPNNKDDLAEKMRQILSDGKNTESFAQAALATVARFDMESNMVLFEQLYEKVVEK